MKPRTLLRNVPFLYELIAIFKMLLKYFCHMPAEDDYLILNRLVKPQGLIIDVGAHRGQSALSFSAIKPDWNIVSFEPNLHCKISLRLVNVSST
jgi:hypothetical protein